MFNPFARRSTTPPPAATPVPAATRTHIDPIAEIELVGDVVVATLTVTELAGDVGAGRLADLLFELGQSGAHHFVLDMQNVQFMDSACLGCMVEALNLMSSSGGRIALASADHAVQSLFRLTRLDRMFPAYHDVMGAITAVEDKPEE